MKKHLYSLVAAATLAGLTAIAQPDAKAPKVVTEKREITINADAEDGGNRKKRIVINQRKNGTEEKMVIVVDGDNVTINGKPAKDFKGNMDLFDGGDLNFDTDVKVHVAPHVFGNGNDFAQRFNTTRNNKAMLGVSTEKDDKGAKVMDVTAESAADKAGIKAGDIITGINGDKITADNDLVQQIHKYKPEDNVDITVLRDGKEKKLNAKLGKNESIDMALNWNGDDENDFNFSMPAMPSMPSLPRMPAMPRMPRIPGQPRNFNFNDNSEELADLYVEKPKFGFSIADNEDGEGVKITGVKEESNAAKAGLKEGDLITEANGTAVKNTDELKKQLADSREKTTIPMKVMRNGSSQSITVKVPKKIKTADL